MSIFIQHDDPMITQLFFENNDLVRDYFLEMDPKMYNFLYFSPKSILYDADLLTLQIVASISTVTADNLLNWTFDTFNLDRTQL